MIYSYWQKLGTMSTSNLNPFHLRFDMIVVQQELLDLTRGFGQARCKGFDTEVAQFVMR